MYLYKAEDGAPTYERPENRCKCWKEVRAHDGKFAVYYVPPKTDRKRMHFIAIFQGTPRFAGTRSNVVDYVP